MGEEESDGAQRPPQISSPRIVLESNRQVKPEDVESAGLQILELRRDKVLVAFAGDPELSEFLERCDKYGLGARGLAAGGNERPPSMNPVRRCRTRPAAFRGRASTLLLPLLADASRMLGLTSRAGARKTLALRSGDSARSRTRWRRQASMSFAACSGTQPAFPSCGPRSRPGMFVTSRSTGSAR